MTDKEWMSNLRNRNYLWMTDNQWECYVLIIHVMRGEHHVGAKPKPCDGGIEINLRASRFSTYDYDLLTKLVIYSHNRAIRVELGASGPGRIKFILHKRNREGDVYNSHPTIYEAVERWGQKDND